jgi:hypothetical protein
MAVTLRTAVTHGGWLPKTAKISNGGIILQNDKKYIYIKFLMDADLGPFQF